MTDTWKAEYRKLMADYNTLVKQNEELKEAVASLLSLPSVGKASEPEALIFLKRGDMDALDKTYREACGYG